jgi:hypothetical protein
MQGGLTAHANECAVYSKSIVSLKLFSCVSVPHEIFVFFCRFLLMTRHCTCQTTNLPSLLPHFGAPALQTMFYIQTTLALPSRWTPHGFPCSPLRNVHFISNYSSRCTLYLVLERLFNLLKFWIIV